MSEKIGENVKFLRKRNGLTQSDLALKTGISRAKIGSYEEGRAEPKLAVLKQLSGFFKIPVDTMLNKELWNEKDFEEKIEGKKYPKILTVVVDDENNEKIVLVPDKASAGYIKGYADPEFIEKLPLFNLPLPELRRDRTYRVFQIKGESMLPIKPGSYIICEYIADNKLIENDYPYILVTKNDGLLFKRIFRSEKNKLLLKSDNPDFNSYSVLNDEITEIWKALGYISFNFQFDENITLNSIHKEMIDLKKELKALKDKTDK